jgi:hypothetical protein
LEASARKNKSAFLAPYPWLVPEIHFNNIFLEGDMGTSMCLKGKGELPLPSVLDSLTDNSRTDGSYCKEIQRLLTWVRRIGTPCTSLPGLL